MSFLLDLFLPSPRAPVPSVPPVAKCQARCHFCNHCHDPTTLNSHAIPSPTPWNGSLLSDWLCEECGQRNVYDSDGEIVSHLPEMSDETKNMESFRRRGRLYQPDPPSRSSSYANMATRPSTPVPSPLSPSFTTFQFCTSCQTNQSLHLSAISSISENITPQQEAAINVAYPLTCLDCARSSNEIVKARDYAASAENWKNMLRGRGNQGNGFEADSKWTRRGMDQDADGLGDDVNRKAWSPFRKKRSRPSSGAPSKRSQPLTTPPRLKPVATEMRRTRRENWEDVVWRSRGMLWLGGLGWTWMRYLGVVSRHTDKSVGSGVIAYLMFTVMSILWIAWNPLWSRWRHQRELRVHSSDMSDGKDEDDMLIIHGRGVLLRNALGIWVLRIGIAWTQYNWKRRSTVVVLSSWLLEVALLAQAFCTIKIVDLTPVPLNQHPRPDPQAFSSYVEPRVEDIAEALKGVDGLTLGGDVPPNIWPVEAVQGTQEVVPMDWEPLGPIQTKQAHNHLRGVRFIRDAPRLDVIAQTGYMIAALARIIILVAHLVTPPDGEQQRSEMGSIEAIKLAVAVMESVLVVPMHACGKSSLATKARVRRAASIAQIAHALVSSVTRTFGHVDNVLQLLGVALSRVGFSRGSRSLISLIFWIIVDGVCWWCAHVEQLESIP